MVRLGGNNRRKITFKDVFILTLGFAIGIIFLSILVDNIMNGYEKGIKQREGIIEWMNRENNIDYRYEPGDEFITPVIVKGVSYPNGTWKVPPLCYGPMCPYNFTGVVTK